LASITTAETATLCTRCGAPLLQDTGPCVACVPSEETVGIPERIGPFRIGSRLGRGPRGAVYRARHDGSEHDVALKVLLDIERVSPNCLRQARAVARMRHANVLSLRSIGRVRGVPFIASDLFNGRSLEEVIRLRGYLNPREALLITRATAAGLESALEDDILHRGVKTTNIFVSATGDVRVADFGHSPRSGTDDEIRSGMIAPERISDEAIDQRADIWSLGMVLFQMLTGGRPIEHFDRGRPRFAGHLADTGPALRALIQEMITIDLDERTPTYQAVTRRIDDALAELDSRQSLEEAETHIASSTRVGVAGLAGLALLIGVGAISSSTSSAAISTWDPPAEIVSAARRGPLLTHQPPTYDAHFDYMLGSESPRCFGPEPIVAWSSWRAGRSRRSPRPRSVSSPTGRTSSRCAVSVAGLTSASTAT